MHVISSYFDIIWYISWYIIIFHIILLLEVSKKLLLVKLHYLLESQSISHIPYTLSLSRSFLCDTPCVPSWLRQLLFSTAICRTWSTDKIDSTRNHPHTLAYTHTYPYPPTSLWQLTHPAYPAHLWSPSSWANFLTKVSNLFECKTVAWLGAYQQLPKWKPKNSFKPLNSFGLDSSLSSPLPFSVCPFFNSNFSSFHGTSPGTWTLLATWFSALWP